ncbi:PASTA domain-containing protein [Streptomyces sp. M2CJ-2]|nr:PASTA domain-containing protein [Streptomyces sp. M2CJ-2]
MRVTPRTSGRTPEVRVPRLVGLMAVDARESARAHGLSLDAPDRPDFRLTVVDHVVRQYPQPGVEVPRGSLVHVWFGFGEGDGGGGVREPRAPVPPVGGRRRELEEPREPAAPRAAVLSRP